MKNSKSIVLISVVITLIVCCICCVCLFLGALLPSNNNSQYVQLLSGTLAAGPEYFIDCVSGSDSNAGTSETGAWKTLSKANSFVFSAGSSLKLKKGCSWSGTLKFDESGTNLAKIYVTSYGEGELPIITSNQNYIDPVVINGNYVTIDGLHVKGSAPRTESGCEGVGVGDITGFEINGSYNSIINSKAEGLSIGILIFKNATFNTIQNNILLNNNLMTNVTPKSVNADDDYGAFSINVWGHDNIISGNTISGSDACSYDYVRDGSAVEVYGGKRNKFHYNQSLNNETFLEMGSPKDAANYSIAEDNYFAYNSVRSDLAKSTFVITRGNTDAWGPVSRTYVYNNSVYLSGANSFAVGCYGGCGNDILTLKNNIVWAEGAIGYSDQPFVETNNLFWRADGNPQVWFRRTDGTEGMNSTSLKVNPQFTDASNLSLGIAATSPAVDKGVIDLLSILSLSKDILGTNLPQGLGVDLGAYEYSTSVINPTSPPAPAPIPPADTTAPTVSITAPVNGVLVNRKANVAVSANATDNTAVTKVEFWLNGTLKATDASAAYTYTFRTANSAGVSYRIEAIAYDAAGNRTSNIVTVRTR